MLANQKAEVQVYDDFDESSKFKEYEQNILKEFDGLQQKIIKLLSSGSVTQEQTALAVGVDPSYISQLLEQPKFHDAIVQIKYFRAQELAALDKLYDNLENKLATKLDKNIDYLVRPRDILDALTRVNSLKRRGSGAIVAPTNQNVVQFNLPVVIVQKFTTNLHNQVIQAGDQVLTTIASNVLLKEFENESGDSAKQKLLPK